MLAKAGPSGEPIATPSVCLYMMSLKLNSTPDVIHLKKNFFLKNQNLPHILGTLTIHLLCFAMKKSRITFPNN